MLISQGGGQTAAEGRTYTMRELSQRTAQVIEEINESGQQALITKHGHIIALITPLRHAQVESIVLSRGPLSDEIQARIDEDSPRSYSSEEVAEQIQSHYLEGHPAPAGDVPRQRKAPRRARKGH